MERYENIIKIEEMRRLVEDEQYVKAYKILQTMDTNRIKSLTDLSIISDVYAQNEEFYKAKSILLRIYEKNKTRRILYQLVDLSIKQGDIKESEEYLYRYSKIAPNDSYQYIFRYCIDKLKEEPLDVLIESLELLKEYDYFEVWAYELAKLYHKAGMKDKCIRECSDIILWFGSGMYVEKARLLKACYVGELNPMQIIKAKDKKEIKDRLGLDKTKDYSHIRSEIDRLLQSQEEGNQDMNQGDQDMNQGDRDMNQGDQDMNQGDRDIIQGDVLKGTSEDTSAFDDLMSTGFFTESTYDHETHSMVESKSKVVNVKFKAYEELESLEDEVYEETSEEEIREDVYEDEVYEETLEEEIKEDVYDDEVYEETLEEEIREDVYEDEVYEETSEEEIREDVYEDEVYEETLEEEIREELYEDEVSEEATWNEDTIDELLELFRGTSKTTLHQIFGYFYYQPEVMYQLERVMETILSNQCNSNNFILIGDKKSGKTSLGKLIAKALYEYNLIQAPKIAKISAVKLNQISLKKRMDSLLDGTLIIEDAHLLDHKTTQDIVDVINTYRNRFVVILEVEAEKAHQIREQFPSIDVYFEHKVQLPKYSLLDKLGFVILHIENQEYQLSDKGKVIVVQAIQSIIKEVPEEKHMEVLFTFINNVVNKANERNKSLLRNMVRSGQAMSNDLLYIEEEDFS